MAWSLPDISWGSRRKPYISQNDSDISLPLVAYGRQVQTAETAEASHSNSSTSNRAVVRFPEPGRQHVDSCNALAHFPPDLLSCLPNNDDPAILSTDATVAPPLSYAKLRGQIASTALAVAGIAADDCVGILMPNGPELAVVLLAVAAQAIAAPLDEMRLARQELEHAFHQLRIRHVLLPTEAQAAGGGVNVNSAKAEDKDIMSIATSCNCQIIFIARSPGEAAGLFEWSRAQSSVCKELRATCLLLQTSGTTSKPKVVALSASGLYAGAVAIGQGLALGPGDVCLNVMPYTHIGGISCSLLASLFAGGAVICAASFDPAVFIQWLADLAPTWYYAAPTIHECILLLADGKPQPLRHSLRFVRSGAASLPHKDAEELRRLLRCTVLPTYSMSECMPVAQPPLDYGLEKPGSVGLPLGGASLCIVAADGGEVALPFGVDGEVCITSAALMVGYLDDASANASSFFTNSSGTWLRTGDLGHLDEDGFLFLTGRRKELIKRGGEQVSPFEVEEVLLQNALVAEAVAFAVPNVFWGEEVAAAVVLKQGASNLMSGADAASVLQRFAAERLPERKAPKQVVCLSSNNALPRTSTGKYVRSRFCEHLHLASVDTAAETKLRLLDTADESLNATADRHFKPHKAIYGLRYLIAAWVLFMHQGLTMQDDLPEWWGHWQRHTFSMPLFFLLAGFLLASSYSEPVKSVWQFYRSRIIAAHPLYLFAVVYSLPLQYIYCPTDSSVNWPGFGGREAHEYLINQYCGLMNIERHIDTWHPILPGSYWQQISYTVVMAALAQLAWPWGTPAVLYFGFPNGALWFTSSYYFCLLCFPLLHWLILPDHASRESPKYCVKPCCVRYIFVLLLAVGVAVFAYSWLPELSVKATMTVTTLVIGLPVEGDGSPMNMLRWAYHPTFPGLNILLFYAYTCPLMWTCIFFLGMVLFRFVELSRRKGAYLWPYWGICTDLCTLWLGVSVALAPVLRRGDTGISWSDWWGGGLAQKRAVTFFLCIWLYGLSIGKGATAKLLGSDLFVKFLSPASYSIYLLHMPTLKYWTLFRYWFWRAKPLAVALDYPLGLALSTLVALFATHKLNVWLTAGFMRCFDALLYCCCCNCFCGTSASGGEEASTAKIVKEALHGLTGATVGPETPLAECGLDSFGTSALLGLLRPRFPKLSVTPLQMYRLRTIQDLVNRIDEDQDTNGSGGAAAAP